MIFFPPNFDIKSVSRSVKSGLKLTILVEEMHTKLIFARMIFYLIGTSLCCFANTNWFFLILKGSRGGDFDAAFTATLRKMTHFISHHFQLTF